MPDPSVDNQVDSAFQLLQSQQEREGRFLGRRPRAPGPATLRGPDASVEQAFQLLQGEERDDPITDDDLARAFVGQDSITEGEPLPFSTRFGLSFLGDNFEEQKSAFNLLRPEGELVSVPNTDVVLFRNSPEERFRKVDQGVVESFVQGGFGRETLGDLADALGDDALAAGMDIAFGRGSASFVRFLARQAGLTAVGEMAQQQAQTAAGTQRQTLREQAREAGGKAVLSIVGGTVFRGVGRGVDLARGRGLLRVTPEGQEAFQASESLRGLGVPVEDPLPIQVIDNPAVKLLGRQSQALISRIGRKLRETEDLLSRSVRGLSDRASRDRLRTRSLRLVEESSEDLKSFLRQSVRSKARDAPEVGRLLRRSVQDWWETSGKAVDDLYLRARALEEPEFDLTPALDVARRIRRGVQGAGREGDLVQVRDLDPRLVSAIERLEKLDPSLPRTEGAASAMDVLREVRSDLSDLALPGPEGSRQANRLAGELSGAIRRVMDNPTNADPEFTSAWKAARTAAAKRFQTREQAAVMDLLRTERLSEFADNLASPGQFDNLVSLARAGGNETLEPVRGALLRKLLDDPFSISNKMADFDRRTLGILLNSQERKAVRFVASRFDEINRSGLNRAIEKQTRIRPLVSDLVDNESSAGIDALSRIVQRHGGKSGSLGTSLRASIMDEVWERSHIVDSTGRRILSTQKLNSTLDSFESRGVLDFLESREREVLKNVELLQRVSGATVDAGTSIQAASAVAGARTLRMSAIQTIAEQVGVGRVLTNDFGRRLLVGVGQRPGPSDLTTLGIIGSVAANLSATSNREVPERGVQELEGISQRLSPSQPEEPQRAAGGAP